MYDYWPEVFDLLDDVAREAFKDWSDRADAADRDQSAPADQPGLVEEVVDRVFMRRLSAPVPVTIQELSRLAKVVFSVPADQFLTAWDIFSHGVHDLIDSTSVNRHTVRVGSLCGYTTHPACAPREPLMVFNKPRGMTVSIHCSDVPSVALETTRTSMEVFGTIEVCGWSRGAFGGLIREVKPLLRSLLKSIDLAGYLDAVEVHPDPRASPPPTKEDAGHLISISVPAPPTLERPTPSHQYGLSVFNPLLDVYWSRQSDEDLVKNRLRTAMRLLVESDRTKHASVALALSCSALEVLLVRDEGELKDFNSQQRKAKSDSIGAGALIGERASTLLQPQPDQRVAAVLGVRKLYGIRNKIMHGQRVDEDTRARDRTRRLAAGVLMGLMEWRRALLESSAKEPSFEDLIASPEFSPSDTDKSDSGLIPKRFRRCLPG